MATRPTRAGGRRRAHLRRTFDGRVSEEWRRYSVSPERELAGTLRERFLRLHLQRSRGVLLELGPGPGRFTPILRGRPRDRVLAIDLSVESLHAARRRSHSPKGLCPVDWIQGAGELLPLPPRSVDVAVVFGNIVSFAADGGPALLKELARVVKPNGPLLLDFASPVAAIQEFLHIASRRRFLPRILGRPKHYLIDQVLRTGRQPYDPARLTRWEFRFYTVAEATRELSAAGFRTRDVMSVAPIAAFQRRIAAIARRESRTWEQLLRLEERAGRREGTYELGHGFLIAAARGRVRGR